MFHDMTLQIVERRAVAEKPRFRNHHRVDDVIKLGGVVAQSVQKCFRIADLPFAERVADRLKYAIEPDRFGIESDLLVKQLENFLFQRHGVNPGASVRMFARVTKHRLRPLGC